MSEETVQAAPVAASAPEAVPSHGVPAEMLDHNPSPAQQEMRDAVAQAAVGGASEEELKELIKEFTVKVNGKERVIKVDMKNDAEVAKKMQMAEAAQESMQKAAEYEKQMKDLLESLKSNPKKLLKEMQLDPNALAADWLEEYVKEQEMSPEEKERQAMRQELEALRQKVQQEELSKKQVEEEKALQEAMVNLDNEIHEALKSNSKLPKTPYVTKRISEALYWAINNGYEVKAADVVPMVEGEIKREIQQLMEDLPNEVLEELVGKKTLERMRMERVKKVDNIKNIQEVAAPRDEKPIERKKMSINDFLGLPTMNK